jgi:hypothetical protein
MSKCTLTLKIKDTRIVHTMPRKEAVRLAICFATTSEPSTFDDEIRVVDGQLTVIAFDVLQHGLEHKNVWHISSASGSTPAELKTLGYDWKAARDARIAAGGAW